MTKLKHRLARLEERMGFKEDRLVVKLVRAEAEFALDGEDCERILAESMQFNTGRIAVLNLLDVPDGLNAGELETYLREHAEEVCGWGQ